MVDYKEAIKRPFSNWKKLTVGAIIYLLVILVSGLFLAGVILSGIQGINFLVAAVVIGMIMGILVGSLLMGYFLRCARDPGASLPEWKGWKEMFEEGFLGVVIGFIYSLPVIIVGGLTVLTFSGAGSGRSILFTAGPMVILTLILALLAAYVSPMAIINYANDLRFKDGLMIRKVLSDSFNSTYFVAWIIAVAYSMVLSVMVGLVGDALDFNDLLVFIPALMEAFMAIVVGVTSFTLYGEAFKEINS